jgi:hypothetical protein
MAGLTIVWEMPEKPAIRFFSDEGTRRLLVAARSRRP